jgi:streptogramin lyase
MFVPLSRHQRIAGLSFTPFASDRRCACRHSSQRNRARSWTRFQLEGLEDRCLLSSISGVTEFPVPGGVTPQPNSIAAGRDGNLWFTESSANAIGMINPITLAVSSFTVPTASSSPRGITAGPDGNLWFTEYLATKVGLIDPTTHAISEFPLPTTLANPNMITAGPDGNLWFTALGLGVYPKQIGEINPTTHVVSAFSLSTTQPGRGITAGPDGNLWFANWADEVGRINPTTDAISYFPTPVQGQGITVGPDGNIWFAGSNRTNSPAVGEINPTTYATSGFSVSHYSFGITAGPDGNIWFAENGGLIGQINPTTDAITEYPVPFANSSTYAITTGPDGNLWFVDFGTNSIGVATLATSQLVVTTQPPASVTAGSGFGLTVQAEDSSGTLISSFNGSVTVALGNNPGGATLGGTLTVQASGGVANFAGLTLNKAASGYTLYTSGGGFGWGVTNAMTVTPAAATQLVITQQPPGTVKVNSGFGFQASIEDQYGNVVTTATNTVSVAFANNPTGATLGGTLSVTASQGVAAFSGLTINKVGNGYTLQVTSSGLSSAVTNAINVTKTGRSPGALSAPAGSVAPDPLLAPLVLDSPDLWVGLGLKKRGRAIN